jgi:hypothetical protein
MLQSETILKFKLSNELYQVSVVEGEDGRRYPASQFCLNLLHRPFQQLEIRNKRKSMKNDEFYAVYTEVILLQYINRILFLRYFVI